MMRPLVIAAPPEAPTMNTPTTTGTGSGRRVVLTWTDNSLTATGFTIQKATNAAFTTGLATFGPLGNVTTFTDPNPFTTGTWYYRMFATNTVGSSVPGYPTMSVDSGLSNQVNVAASTVPAPNAPTNAVATLLANGQIRLTFRDNSTNETGFVIERSVNGGAFAVVLNRGASAGTGTVTFNDTTVVAGSSYQYRVAAVGTGGTSAYAVSNTVMTRPPAPNFTSLTMVTLNPTTYRLTVTWTDVPNETSFTIQGSTSNTFPTGAATSSIVNIPANTTTWTIDVPNLAGSLTYYLRVAGVNASGTGAWSNVRSIVLP